MWVDFLIKLGFGWPSGTARARRISLVSMPCDSAGAGLVTLGAMIRDLGNSAANDSDGHYDALLRHARQFLDETEGRRVTEFLQAHQAIVTIE
jgi:hypothetical protein